MSGLSAQVEPVAETSAEWTLRVTGQLIGEVAELKQMVEDVMAVVAEQTEALSEAESAMSPKVAMYQMPTCVGGSVTEAVQAIERAANPQARVTATIDGLTGLECTLKGIEASIRHMEVLMQEQREIMTRIRERTDGYAG